MTKHFVGIQMAPISLVDEGLENVLDLCKEQAKVSAIMYGAYSYSYANAGRAAEAFPDHGVAERYNDFVGGAYFEPHQQYYGGTILKGHRAPEPLFSEVDMLQKTIEAAKARDMEVYPWLFEAPPPTVAGVVPNYPKVLEVDVYGRKAYRPCFNNPDYRHHILSYVEDLVKSYDIPGVMWGAERRGPLMNLIQLNIVPVCFCEHCQAAGRERGIDPERARQGYLALLDFVKKARGDAEKPVDGYFVTFLRLLLHYPEILAWENLWTESKHSMRAEIYGTVKAIDPNKQVGWHIWHQRSFSPLFRAEEDYAGFKNISDWIKPVVYDNPAGIRFYRYTMGLQETILKDVKDPQLIADVLYAAIGYKQGPLTEIPAKGWDSDYVYAETKLSVERSGVPVYAGIGINIPSFEGNKQTTPEDVRSCVKAAVNAGATGLVISRQYCEMELRNLRAVGEALNEIGW